MFHLQLNNDKQWHSDNDEDCSCSSDENMLIDNNITSFNPAQSMNISTISLFHNNYYSTSNISHINNSLNGLNKHDHFSINYNRPSINSLKKSKIKHSIIIPNEFVSTKKINKQHLSSIENHEDDKQQTSFINFEHIYKIIDQSYTKIPILYNSIKHIKLDRDFILSVNNYLDHLKTNIYKDLIRRETLLRNGKNHTRNLISLIHCICKISYQQALEISNNSIISKHAILYTMTAINYILQNNFPQKKALFNYILNEYISMWLHENLRIIQEDFCIIIKNGTKKNFFQLCICLFHKLESICAINWERLQMIQNYRLTYFNELFKPTSIKLETNKDFILLFGKSLKLTMKTFDIPITSLYSNRTDNELMNINKIHQIFRKSIAKILLQQFYTSTNNFIEEDQKLILPQSYSQQIITPSIEITSSTAIKLNNGDLNSKNTEKFQSSILDEDQSKIEKSTWNIISETHTQSIEPILLLPRQTSLTSLPSDILDKQQRSFPSESKSVFLEDQQRSLSIEMTPKQNTSNSIHTHQSSSHSDSLLSHSQTSTKMKIDTSPLVKSIELINSFNEPTTPTPSNLFPQSLSNASILVIPIKSESQIDIIQKMNSPSKFPNEDNSSNNLLSTDHSLQDPSTLTFASTKKPFIDDHLSLSAHPMFSDKSTSMDSKAILNTEVNALINFLIELSYSSLSVQQEKETSPLLKQLESCLKQNNIHSNSIVNKIRNTHSQSFLNVKDPLFLAEFTRVLRKELQDAQILRDIDCGQLNKNSQNIDSINRKSTDSTLFNNQQLSSLESSNHSQKQWYWMHSNEYSSCKDCLITSNSLFCAGKSFDKNTYSITVEHNEEFQ